MITVFTPTYNRAKNLVDLYESLVGQTCKDFEWLIVDDGSQDNTETLIGGWLAEEKLKIRYYKQENGGKHRAINLGVKIAEGALFFIVDSDDYLMPEAVEIVKSKFEIIEDNNDIGGIAFRRKFTNGIVIGNAMPKEVLLSSVTERRYKLGINGDFVEIFKTSVLKKFPFPDFVGEKFCAEGLVWHRISLTYKVLHFEQAIYVCEYLEGGLSDRSIINRRKSMNYILLTNKELFHHPQVGLKYKCKAGINYWRFGFASSFSIRQLFKDLNGGLLSVMMMPLGLLTKLRDDKKIKRNGNKG